MSIINNRTAVVWWQNLEKWAMPRRLVLPDNLPPTWNITRVKDFATQITERVKVDKNRQYKMVGVRWYGEGTFHRETVQGKSLSASYVNPLIENTFIYNRLFAWKKSFAVVPRKHADCFVSNEFPQFIIDEKKILPEYLYLIFMSKKAIDVVNSLSIGSAAVSRKRFKEEDFRNIEIPFPSLETQQAIVERWQNAQDEIQLAKKYAENLIQDTETDCLSKLGITVPPPKKLQGATSLNWRNLERWDTFFYRPDFLAIENQLASIQNAPLNEVLSFTSRGWNRTDFPDGSFKYVEISSVMKEEGITGSKTISIANPPSRATTLVRKGDIIISTTRPYLGAITVVPDEYDCCVCSSGFALADSVKNHAIEKDFVVFFLKTAAGLRQMERRMTGGLYPAIVQEELEKIRVPIPSQAIQRSILKQIMVSEKDIKQKRELVELKQKQTKAEIEALILGIKKLEDLD